MEFSDKNECTYLSVYSYSFTLEKTVDTEKCALWLNSVCVYTEEHLCQNVLGNVEKILLINLSSLC